MSIDTLEQSKSESKHGDQGVLIKDKILLTVKEAAEYSGIGLNRIQSLLKMPKCPFVLFVGRKKLIKRRAFEKFLEDNVFI